MADDTGIIKDLYYYRARYYDPMQGCFISQDPIEFMAGDVNFYRYVGGNPVNFVDPSGLVAPAVALWEIGVAIFEWATASETIAIGAGAAGRVAGGIATRKTGQKVVTKAAEKAAEKVVSKTGEAIQGGEKDPCDELKNDVSKYCKSNNIDLGSMKNLGEFNKNLDRAKKALEAGKRPSKKPTQALELKEKLDCPEIKKQKDYAEKCADARKKMTDSNCPKAEDDPDGIGHEEQEQGFRNRAKNLDDLLSHMGCK